MEKNMNRQYTEKHNLANKLRVLKLANKQIKVKTKFRYSLQWPNDHTGKHFKVSVCMFTKSVVEASCENFSCTGNINKYDL